MMNAEMAARADAGGGGSTSTDAGAPAKDAGAPAKAVTTPPKKK
jgi:hypothetical protein